MRQTFRCTFLMIFMFLLAACGGSGGSLNGGSSGSTGGVGTAVPKITLTLVDPTTNETITEITTVSPGTVRALVTLNNVPQVDVKVDFTLPDGVGELSQTSKLTGDDGIAFVTLNAGSVTNAGTVTATYEGQTDSTPFNVTISLIDSNVVVAMSDVTTTPNSIGANGTAALEVIFTQTINGETTPLSQSVPVEFTSNCAALSPPLAIIDTGVTTFNGKAVANYRDQGCGREDTIRVLATVGQEQFSAQTTLDVMSAKLRIIEFKSATPNVISLKGSGGASRGETSSVVFVVKDVIGNVARDAAVRFSLKSNVGGITLSPTTEARTNNDGEVTVIVASGTVPTPVVVIATLVENPNISTISSGLSISTGIADSNSFSISVSNFAPEAWNIDNTTVNITARLADHFNNHVPDGTVVNFSTEFGAIKSECSTTNGACTVAWNSQAPRSPDPAFRDINAKTRSSNTSHTCYDLAGNVTKLSNLPMPCPGTWGAVYGNRVTIFAHALGEESFTDGNSNGRYDNGEAYTDLGEAFIDHNNDNVFSGRLGDGTPSAGAIMPDYRLYRFGQANLGLVEPGGDNEEFVDRNQNNSFDGANGLYNGILCNDAREGCTPDLVTIYKNVEISQSSSGAFISVIESDKNEWEPAEYATNDTVNPVRLYETIVADDPSTPVNEEERGASVSRVLRIFVSDYHNGPMPTGTTVRVIAGNGEFDGKTSFLLGANSKNNISEVQVNIKRDIDGSNRGVLTVTVTTPSGVETSTSILVID